MAFSLGDKESELKLADVGKIHLILETFWYNHEIRIAISQIAKTFSSTSLFLIFFFFIKMCKVSQKYFKSGNNKMFKKFMIKNLSLDYMYMIGSNGIVKFWESAITDI